MFRFCPECGTKKGPFIKGFCTDCYLKKHQLIVFPEKIKLEYCNRCGKVKIQRQWTDIFSLELTDLIKSKIKSKDFIISDVNIEFEEVNEKESNALLKVKGLMENVPLILSGRIVLEKASGICDACMKISSDYFEAIIQARFKKKSNELKEKVLEEFNSIIFELSKSDPLSRIVKTEKKIGGFDLVLSSNRAAKLASDKMARKHSSNITKSFSVVGTNKTGREKRRYTYCVRF